MPRKATQKPAQDQTGVIDQEQLQDDFEGADKRNRELAEIDANYGDGLPYDPARIINETQFYLQQSAGAMLEAGKRLLLLKEHEPHGEFTEALEKIGIEARAARKMMQAAVKFSGGKRPLTAVLGKTKLLELLAEDDEQLEDLADGGTLAGHTLDEIERMSSKELRAALRKERKQRAEDQEANERLITNKNKKIDDLDQRVHDLQNHARPWSDKCQEINTEVTRHSFDALQALDQLDVLRDTILLIDTEEDTREAALEAMGVVYFDAIDQIVSRLAEVSHACNEVFMTYKSRSQSMLAAHGDVTGSVDE